MIMWVVMGNDFPEGVFSSEERADAFCASKKAGNDQRRRDHQPGIHWRVYEFAVDEKCSA